MAKVSDVMTSPVITIRAAATIADAIQRMLNHSIHTLIVDRQHAQDAYGILTNLDIVNQVVAFGRDPKRMRVFEIMTKPCMLSTTDILKHEAILNRPREALLTAQLEAAKDKAEKICHQFGPGSLQCAETWARVEALETELAHQQAKTIDKTAYELFREENPAALNPDEYDAWCSG